MKTGCWKSTVFRCLLWLAVATASSTNENNATSASGRYLFLDEEQLMKGRFLHGGRKPRFLSFETTDEDIRVEMQLALPFLSLPIKKTIAAGEGMVNKLQTANINIGSLSLGALILFGAAVVAPQIARLFSADHVEVGPNTHTVNRHHGHGVFERTVDEGAHWTEKIGRELEDRGMQPRACAARAICSLVRRSMEAKEGGAPESADKIVDGLISNDWLMGMLQETVFHEAITFGFTKNDCNLKYADCKVNHSTLQNIAKAVTTMATFVK